MVGVEAIIDILVFFVGDFNSLNENFVFKRLFNFQICFLWQIFMEAYVAIKIVLKTVNVISFIYRPGIDWVSYSS